MDPMLSLSFAIHSNPGVYAALLGSGISRAASIPTGWEVVLDLVRKLATASGDDCGDDPARWFRNTYQDEPSYSVLLQKLGPTPAERQHLLSGYFEPTERDEEVGAKTPTAAHRAIASLAKSGHVRVILTTNFDRLMERALEQAGVSPAVISTPDAVEGAVPLVHARCTVVKVHGDYLDARIKNTPQELASYDRRLRRFLDRVFDEFGLIVCGWSADWDEALRGSIERSKSRRYTTYWATHGELSDSARRLVDLRAAKVIAIASADQFFPEVESKVTALASFDQPHPLSAKAAAATMKRYLSEERFRIALHDLLNDETERFMDATSELRTDLNRRVENGGVYQVVRKYEMRLAVLQALLITGAHWGGPEHVPTLARAIERLANHPAAGGYVILSDMRRYPAAVAFYACGLAALAGRNFQMLRSLFVDLRVRGKGGALGVPAMEALSPSRILQGDAHWQTVLPGAAGMHAPLSRHLAELLREPLRELIPADDAYQEAFDRFEYFMALVLADTELIDQVKSTWVPLGRFSWERWGGRDPEIVENVAEEVAVQGSQWPPIKGGLFASAERVRVAAAAVAENLKQRPPW